MKWYELIKNWAGQEAGKQIQMSPADGQSLVDSGFAKEIPVDISAEIVANATQTAANAMADSIGKSVGDVVEKALAAVTTTIKRPTITPGESQDEKTKCFSDFLKCVSGAMHTPDPNVRERLEKVYRSKAGSTLAENNGTLGGYLIPQEFLDRLLQLSMEKSVVRSRAEVLPLSGRSMYVPMLDQSSIYGTGITPFLGGVAARWTGENSLKPVTNPQFKQVELVANELSGLAPVSRQLMADSAVALDPLLSGLFARAIAWYEDYAFLNGSGAAQPRGVLNSNATIAVNRTTSNKFQLADAANMLAKLLPDSYDNAVWVISQTVLPQLIQLADTSGRVVYLPNPAATAASGGPATQRIPMMLFGLPVLVTEKLLPLGNAGDVLLCDFSKYLIGDRQAIEIAVSEHYMFGNNELTWRFLHRVDGQPWLDNYITYQDGTTTVSPFVKLV